jgi:predicted RNase H-like HicB family nuclease
MELDMNYPIVIHKDKESDYGVAVPDLPGCFSAGSTLDEALAMAREAIELHLEGLLEEELPVPDPGTIEQHRRDPRYRGGVWAVVSVEPGALPEKARRINITMPRRVVDAVDRFARAQHQTRSGLLTRAAAAYVAKGRVLRRRSGRHAHARGGA